MLVTMVSCTCADHVRYYVLERRCGIGCGVSFVVCLCMWPNTLYAFCDALCVSTGYVHLCIVVNPLFYFVFVVAQPCLPNVMS